MLECLNNLLVTEMYAHSLSYLSFSTGYWIELPPCLLVYASEMAEKVECCL
jgi:hypothetical protein